MYLVYDYVASFHVVFITVKYNYGYKICIDARKFEDAKGVIRSRKSRKYRQYNDHKKKDKRTNNIYKTVCRKLKIEQHEPH